MKLFKRILRYALILAFWLGVWALGAWAVGKPLLLPYPTAVIKRLLELMHTLDFYEVILHSLWNILFGIAIALLLGIFLAVLTHKIRILREVLLPAMTVIKATPVASFIILLLIFIGSARIPTVITVLIVLPVVWTNLDEGFAHIDPQLRQMTQVYRFSPWRRLRYLTIPSLMPYFVSACRTSVGLAWKAGVAAEVIAMPLRSIGTMIGEAKQYILTEDMFAWTLCVVLLSLLIELLFSFLFQKIGKGFEVREVKNDA